MNPFEFFLDTRIDFGSGSLSHIIDHIKKFEASKILLVLDRNVLKLGLVDKLLQDFTNEKVNYHIYDNIDPNPRLIHVDNGVLQFLKRGCNLVVAVGGGSTIDVAKGICVVAKNGGKCFDYLDGRNEKKRAITDSFPLIAVPTTAGTGSEVTMYSVIMDDNLVKDSITSTYVYPSVAVIDPLLMKQIPRETVIYTGLDAFAHALEAYTSNIPNALCDVFSLESLKLIFEWLPVAVNENTLQSKEKMAFASMLAGIAMSHQAANLPHALGCALGANYNLSHGLAVAALILPMIKYNSSICVKEFEDIVNYVSPTKKSEGEGSAVQLTLMVKELFEKVGFSYKIGCYPSKEILDKMIHDASIHGCLLCNKKTPCEQDIKDMFLSIV
jgi:alcohol dehydrogenase class IV